jgi:hypothetical protein
MARRGETKRSAKRIACCVIGIILLFISGVISREMLYEYYYDWTAFDTAAIILWLLGIYLVLQGSYWWAKEKGRSGWWCLMGLLAPIGYLVLMSLKDKRLEQEYMPEATQFESQSQIADRRQPSDKVRTEKGEAKGEINFCPHCGQKLEGVMSYCPNCGEKLR